MRKAFTITAATLLSIGVLGGGIAVASNGTVDQDRDRTQSCTSDCDGTSDQFRMQMGMEDGQPSGTQERERIHLRDGTGEQYQHQYRHHVQSGQETGGEHHFGATGGLGDGDCKMDDED